LQETFQYTRRITKLPLLVRLDSGNDSADNIRICEANQTDYLVKRNLRIESLETWLATAKEYGPGCIKREGKIVYMGSVMRRPKGFDKERHLVYRVVERNILANGQILLTPEIEVDTYWTSLPDPAHTIVELYHDHGTSEQFHSEIKTDLDLERLPTGKFETNALILLLGVLAYNILRIMRQMTVQLGHKVVPLRNKAQRRRIRTVIKNLITIASRRNKVLLATILSI